MTVPPTSDLRLLPFAGNLSTRLTSSGASYGITSAQATVLASLFSDYETKQGVVDNPGTRTKAATLARNTSRSALLVVVREYCKIIKANPAVSDSMRALLGLPPRDGTPTPAPVPAVRPILTVDPFGNVTIREENAPAGRRGKPVGTIGAVLFTAILPAGTPAPATPDEARFAALATRDKFPVPLPADSGGKFVYVMAQYLNAKGQPGPVSAVVASRIAA